MSATSAACRLVRLHSSLAFSFAWVPVMFTAFTIDRGLSVDQYTDLWSLYYLVMVVVELPLGWLADRVGHRALLIAGSATLAAASLALGLAEGFAVCQLAMAATGAGHAMLSGADSAYLYELLLGEGRAAEALTEESAAYRCRLFGVSAADLAGGLVAWALGTAAAFHLSAGLMAAATLVALRLPSVPPARRRERQAPARAAPAGRTGVDLPGVVWVAAWSTALFVLVRVGFQLYQPTLIERGASDLRLHGGLLCALNLGAGLAALAVRPVTRRLGERGTAVFVLGLMAVSFAGLTGGGTLLLVPLLGLQQISFAFLQPVARTALNQRVPSRDRAAWLSGQSMLARLAFSLVLGIGSWEQALDSALPGTYAVLGWIAAGLALLFLVWAPRTADA